MARSVVTTREVAAPARKVWQLLARPDRMTEWRGGLARVDMVTDTDFGPGCRYRLTFAPTEVGTRPTEEVEVTGVQEGVLVAELHEVARLPYQQLTLVVPRGEDSCEVVTVVGQAGTSLLDRAIGATAAVLDDPVRRVQAAFLDDVAAAVTGDGRPHGSR